MRTKEFDKIAGSDFERAKRGPKGAGQDVRSNLSTPTIFLFHQFYFPMLMKIYVSGLKFCACSSLG